MGLEFHIGKEGFNFGITKAAAVVPAKAESKYDPTKVAKGNRFVPVAASEWDFGRELVTTEDFNSMVNAYRSVVYIAAKKNATAFASGNLKLYVAKKEKKKLFLQTKAISKATMNYMFSENNPIQSLPCVRKAKEMEEVVDHQILDLLTNVNPFMNKFELLELTETFLELTGNAYWYIFRNPFPVEIWVMPAHRMRVVPSKDQFIQGYVYLSPGGAHIPFTTDEIIHFKFPNPNNLYYGWSPLSAVADAYNQNIAMDKFNVSTLKNNAVPPIVLVAPPDADFGEAEWKRIKRRWDQTYGGTNAGKAAWLEGGWDVKNLAITPRELNFLTSKKDLRMEIYTAYDIPMSQITSEDVNRANAEAGEYQYAKRAVVPRQLRFQEKVNEKFCPMFDIQLFLMFDNVVPEDKVYILQERTAHLGAGVTVINEERKKLGMDDVDWGERPIMSSTMVSLPTEEEKKAKEEQAAALQQAQTEAAKKPPEEVVPEKPEGLKPGEKPLKPGEKPVLPKPGEKVPPEKKEIEDDVIISLADRLAKELDRTIQTKILHYGL